MAAPCSAPLLAVNIGTKFNKTNSKFAKGMGDVEYGKVYDFCLPVSYLRLLNGSAVNVIDMWRIHGRGTNTRGLIVVTITKPKLGLEPVPVGEVCYGPWQNGDSRHVPLPCPKEQQGSC